jgi:hypothetical protein
MQPHFSSFMVLGSGGYPWVAVFTLVGIILYQLFSGKLIGLRWEPWVLRNQRPKEYWTIFAIEASIVLGFLCLGVLSR